MDQEKNSVCAHYMGLCKSIMDGLSIYFQKTYDHHQLIYEGSNRGVD